MGRIGSMRLRSFLFKAVCLAVLTAFAALFVTWDGTATTAAYRGDASPEVSPAPEPQLPVTVTGVDGQTVTVEDIERIVPLSGDIAEILWTLGLGDKIVGVDVSAV